MIRVGVTGGIGSGKTTLCKEWEKLGAFVVYADDLAKKLMVEDEELVKKIKSTFGDKAYDEYGSLNRQYLAQEAFEKGRVNELNNLVHPVLWKKVEFYYKTEDQMIWILLFWLKQKKKPEWIVLSREIILIEIKLKTVFRHSKIFPV